MQARSLARKSGAALFALLAAFAMGGTSLARAGSPARSSANAAAADGGTASQVPACSDGVDNDGDTLVDMDDPGCSRPGDESEVDSTRPQCDDGLDNDGDGQYDVAQDPGCSSRDDNSEAGDGTPAPPAACSDGVDNDGDTLVDMDDPGCSSPS